jgi:hypothetical protein
MAAQRREPSISSDLDRTLDRAAARSTMASHHLLADLNFEFHRAVRARRTTRSI